MLNLSTSDIKNIKEKLVKFKNKLFNNNKIKKDPNEFIDIKYIRHLFNEVKNKKSDLYKIQKMKKIAIKKIKNIKDLNEYKGIKGIRYLFNDNIYNGIVDIRYLFNEDYYVEKSDSKNIKSEFKKLSKNLVAVYARDITYMVDFTKGEKLTERSINSEDIRDKYIVYNE